MLDENIYAILLAKIENIEKAIMRQNSTESTKTIGEYFCDWLNAYKIGVVGNTSYKRYESVKRNYIIPLFGNIPLANRDATIIQNQLMKIESSCQREYACELLKEMYKKAIALQLVVYNPMLAVDIPKHVKKSREALTEKEERKFIKLCLQDEYGLMFIIMLYTGIRLGEARALTKGDFYDHNGAIRINKSINNYNVLGNTKTLAGNRIVFVQDALKPFLNMCDFSSLSDNDRLFNITQKTASNHFIEIMKKMKLYDGNHTTHSMRHTFTTRCFECGLNPKVISELVGHTNVAFTMSKYQHVSESYKNKEIKKLNKKEVKKIPKK